jgi:hypothetical protein
MASNGCFRHRVCRRVHLTALGNSARDVFEGTCRFFSPLVGIDLPRHENVTRAFCSLPKRRKKLSFTGPFSPNQELIKTKTENSWTSVRDISFSSPAFDCLGVSYQFRGDADPSRTLHLLVTVRAFDGTTYTLFDAMRSDARLRKPKRMGSVIMSTGSINVENLPLPVKPSEIATLTVCFAMSGA